MKNIIISLNDDSYGSSSDAQIDAVKKRMEIISDSMAPLCGSMVNSGNTTNPTGPDWNTKIGSPHGNHSTTSPKSRSKPYCDTASHSTSENKQNLQIE